MLSQKYLVPKGRRLRGGTTSTREKEKKEGQLKRGKGMAMWFVVLAYPSL